MPTSRPEILHVLLYAARGGCERDAWCLCHGWKEADHRVLVLGAPGVMTPDFLETGATVEHLDVLHKSRRAIMAALRARAATLRSDALILWHGMPLMPLILHALSRWRGRVFVHGGNPARRDPWLATRYLVAEKLFPTPHWPTYVCCSRYVAKSFELSPYLRRFPREVILNGVESPGERIHQVRPVSATGPATAGMMARLDPTKDFATVLMAVAHVRRETGMDLRLELAGDGPDRQRLETLARGLGLGKAMRFLGSVRDVYAAMASWDVFLYATSEAEGFGNVLAEAMAFGLPSVVTDVGPMREVGGAGGAVHYTPPRDPAAMAWDTIDMLRDEQKRHAMAVAARCRATAEFSTEVFTRHYARLLLGGHQA